MVASAGGPDPPGPPQRTHDATPEVAVLHRRQRLSQLPASQRVFGDLRSRLSQNRSDAVTLRYRQRP